MRGHAGRGFTLLEALAGLAIGLIVVTAATAFALGHLRDDQAAWARSRLLRELRMASDVVAHDLRRAGHWAGAAPAAWRPAASGAPPANPYAALAPDAAASDAVQFSYASSAVPRPVADDERLGFRLRGGVVEMMLGAGRWQALTDAGSVVVTEFTITPTVERIPLRSLCPTACPASAPECGPVQSVRSVAIVLGGRSVAHPPVERLLRSVVRLRNDVVAGACPQAS